MAIIELKGLPGLNKSDRESYINNLKSLGAIDNTWTDLEIDRLYRNEQFVDRFGEDMFYQITDPNERDILFRDAILEEEKKRFKNDPNIDIINKMEPESQQELFESGYLAPEERSEEALSKDSLTDNQELLLNKVAPTDIIGNVVTRGMEGGTAGWLAGLGLSSLSFGISIPVATGVGAAVGAVTGAVEGLYNRFWGAENLTEDVNALNDELFSEAYEKDVNRKRNSKEVQGASNDISNRIKQGLSDDSFTYEQLDELFNTITGNQGTDDNPIYGSIHYQRFKDSYLKDIDTDTKIKIVSDFMSMQQYYPEAAFEGIDQIFQNIAADRQSIGEEYYNVVQRNFIGFCNDIVQLSTDAIGMGIQAVAGDEAARAFIEEGKIGDFDLGYLGADFWNKAAKYNTLSPSEIEKAEKFGGLSEGINIREVGASEYNLNTIIQESLGQMHYLAYYAAMGRLFGGLGGGVSKKFGASSWQNTVTTSSAVVVPNLSMSAQMGYEAYESTKDALMPKYQEAVQNTLSQLVQPELDKIDWDRELQNYKRLHSRETERVLMSDEQIIDMLKEQKLAELYPSYIEQAKSANADILREVTSQSIDAFRMESIVDLMKNSVNSTTFRSWMYNNNKTLQRTINRDNPIRFRGNTAVAEKKPKFLFARTALKEMAGEGIDEYLDGVTTGMTEGYNVAQFDGWLLNRENPNTLDGIDITFKAMSGASMGIRNAFNEDNLYEAALGAISPWLPLFNRGSAKSGSTWRPFVTNAIYEEYVREFDKYSDAEARVSTINTFLTENEDRIRNIAKLNASNAALDRARLSGDERAIKEAEQQQLIEAASLINLAQGIASDADMVKQMSETLEKLSKDEYGAEEKKQLGAEFVGQAGNNNMTVEQGYERMRHNAQKLLDTATKMKKIQAEIDKHPNSDKLSSAAKNHLVALALQQEDWKTRLSQITKELGIGDSSSSILTVNDMANIDDANTLTKEISDNLSIVSSNNKEIEEEIKSLLLDKDKIGRDGKLDIKTREARVTKVDNKIEGYRQALEQGKKEEDRLRGLLTKAQESIKNWNDNKEVISADSIMGMSAAKIGYMIENKAKYSAEQRAQIDEVINRLTNKDPNYLTKLEDARKIALSIEEGNRTKTAIQEGPQGYNILVSRLEDAQVKAQIRKEANRYKNQVFLQWENLAPEEILQDAVKYQREDLIDEYRKLNRSRRSDELQGISDVVKFQKDLTGLVNKPDKAIAEALKQSIVNITSQARTRNEAISLLNKVINDTSLPINIRNDIKELLDTAKILDKAASVTYQQEKEEIVKREETRKKAEKRIAEYDAAQAAWAEERADEEAKERAANSTSSTPSEESSTPKPDGSNIEEVIPVGNEPVSQVDEEEVDLGLDFKSESTPTTDSVIEKKLDEAEKTGKIEDADEETSEEVTTTGKAQEGEFVGNAYSRYRVVDGIVKLREGVEAITKKLKSIFEWFDSANIRFQEVIDNELNAISKLHPDVKILKVRPSYNATNDAAMRDVYMLVVEYSEDIANIHKGDDSIITADGKKWLVIGSLGYNSAIKSQTDNFLSLTKNYNPLDKRFREFWRTHPNERFHVDEIASTKISRINPGRLVRGTDENPTGEQTISELLSSKGVKLKDAKWAISKGKELKVVGRINGVIINDTGVAEKSGTVWLLIPAAGGQYIASYIQPSYTDTLKEGSELKKIIDGAFTKLVSPNYEDRAAALNILYQYVYFDKDNGIIIRDKDSITVTQGGVTKSYPLNDPNTSVLSIINELLKSHFRIQIMPETLSDKALLSMYDESGALMTDLQKYGVSGADFNVFEMDTNGVAIIPEDFSPKLGQITVRRSRERSNTVLYNGKLYTQTYTGWRDFNGRVVTDETQLRHLSYLNEIIKGKAPSSATTSHKQYVFSYDRDNPIVIAVSNNSATVTEFSKEEAVNYLEELEARSEQDAKERALDKAMEDSFSPNEDVDLNSDIDLLDKVQSNGFEEWLLGDESGTESEEEKKLPDKSSESIIPDLSKLGTTSRQDTTEGGTSVNEIMIYHMNRFISLVTEKQSQGLWLDFPMDSNEDMLEYFKKNDIPIDNIDDIDAWFDMVKNCR